MYFHHRSLIRSETGSNPHTATYKASGLVYLRGSREDGTL